MCGTRFGLVNRQKWYIARGLVEVGIINGEIERLTEPFDGLLVFGKGSYIEAAGVCELFQKVRLVELTVGSCQNCYLVAKGVAMAAEFEYNLVYV